ncbi:MAG: alpha/beta fold hydrolase [Nannocystaceae bacterium]|nr:alpha/beta hydrolase [bacterium]
MPTRRGELRRPDGTRIAYRVTGDRGPWLLLCNGVTTTHNFWSRAVSLWPHRRVIQWDYPGHGQSSPAQSPTSAHMLGLAETCVALLDALDVERASLAGFSMGSQVALLTALEHPQRCDAAVSVLGPSGKLFDTALWGVGGKTFGALLRVLRGPSVHLLHKAVNLATLTPATYAVGRLLALYGAETSKQDVAAITAHMRTLHAPTLREMLLSAGALDLGPRLSSLDAPLLIITGERDAFAPAKTVGRPMKANAPDAELVVLQEGTHGSLFGHAPVIAATIDRFLEARGAAGQIDPAGADLDRDASGLEP